MQLMIYVLCNKEVGFGHWYRALALAEAAETRGHRVIFLGDKQEAAQITVRAEGPLTAPVLNHALTRYHPEWLLYDTPWAPSPSEIWNIHGYDCKVAWLDAGPEDRGAADLYWAQDDPARVILKNGYAYAKYEPQNHWLVFGGANDNLGLTKLFDRTMNVKAYIIRPDDAPQGMLSVQRKAYKACLAMGHTAWECAALGVPIYLFSPDQKHLTTAMKMAKLGYSRSWPDLGLPDQNLFKTFLEDDFTPHGPPIRGGADNLLNALEERKAGV